LLAEHPNRVGNDELADLCSATRRRGLLRGLMVDSVPWPKWATVRTGLLFSERPARLIPNLAVALYEACGRAISRSSASRIALDRRSHGSADDGTDAGRQAMVGAAGSSCSQSIYGWRLAAWLQSETV
jgi:hypothetical protein